MVFLNPAILLGLLAASIPILIHILNFRKLKKVEFSTLSFLKELQKTQIKKVKIKQWLLLLLRTLIIIFLVLAFAKPTLENVSLIGTNSSAKSSLVFILDNSFSMNYVSNGGSNFNKSKKIAKKLIAQLEEGDEFNFIVNLDSIVTTYSKETANKIIDNYEISLAYESITLKLNNAIEILSSSQTINKEIFLFSDLQESTFSDSIKINTTNGIRCFVFNISSQDPINYSVTDITLENSILEKGKTISFTSTIKNYSDENVTDLVASLFFNDKRVAQQSVNILQGKSGQVKFGTTLNESGLIKVKVELEEDKLQEDNNRFLSFYVPEKLKILILYSNNKDVTFVESALEVTNQFDIDKINTKNVSNYNLAKYDIVILSSSHINNKNQFVDYFNTGGQLLFIPNNNIDEQIISSLNEIIKLPKLEQILEIDPNKLTYSEFSTIQYEHPIFNGLFETRKEKQIESPKINKYLKFLNNSSYNPIISLSDKTVFLGEYSIGIGKVLFFNIAFDLNWSNFPIKGIFAPLLSRIAHYLAINKEQKNSFLISENIPISTNNLVNSRLEVISPNSTDKIIVDLGSNNKFNYSNTYIPGNYEFINNNNLITFASVNVNNIESNLNKISTDSLDKQLSQLFNSNYLVFEFDDNYTDKINQARFGTELWQLFLIIALLIALFEMFIARSTKKDLINIIKH